MTGKDSFVVQADRALIEDLLYEYCDAFDAADRDRTVSLFTPDCVLEEGGQSPVEGRDALDAYVVEQFRAVRATSHHCSNVQVELTDEAAASVSSYLLVWQASADGRQHRRFLRCRDDVTRVGDTWLIKRRQVRDVAGASDDATQADAVFEVMQTSRAVRRFRDEPIPDRLLHRLVQAATWAPSPQNRQPWEFVVLTSPDALAVMSDAIGARAEVLDELADGTKNPGRRKMFTDVAGLVRGIGRVPAAILVCGHPLGYDSPAGSEAALLSALHSASQNLLLGARALGIGAVFTTLHAHGEPAIREGLGIPAEVVIAGTIILGWPTGPVGPVRRRPVEDVLHWQRWSDDDLVVSQALAPIVDDH